MTRPRLLLIDDEPQLAAFVASAARMCGFDPITTDRDEDFRAQLLAEAPRMVALDLGMPGMDGVELLRFLADQEYAGPVLIISGFDRRVLESAFRLGEALGLQDGRPAREAGPARCAGSDIEAATGQSRAMSPGAMTGRND